VSVLLEGSADGVAARAERMLALVGGTITGTRPGWWHEVPEPGDDGTLVRVSFWVSALGSVLDAIDEAARETGTRPAVSGPAGAGVLYVTLPAGLSAGTPAGARAEAAGAAARFVARVRAAIRPGRGGAVVLTAPEAVRAALAGGGGLAGDVPGLALMRAVKDQFDPGHRMAPGRFPS
jgi:glycolate oxidase FAD binding subunit